MPIDPILTVSILTLVALLIALLLFSPAFGLKFKKHGFALALLYSVVSSLAALCAVFTGALVLMTSVWAALGGGHGVLGFLAFGCAVAAITDILVNAFILFFYAKLLPDFFESKSKLSIILASTLVVVAQGVCFLTMMYIGPIGFNSPRLLFGYVNKSGQFAIPPAFAEAEKFHNGLAVVWPEGSDPEFVDDMLALPSYNVIDNRGKVKGTVSEKEHKAIREKYRYTNPEDYFESADGGSSFGIHGRESGWQQFQGIGSDIAEKFFEGTAVKQNSGGNKGYVGKDGKFVVEPKYNDALRFSEGLAAVKLGNSIHAQWGYIDKTGKTIIEPRFDMVSPFHEGLACVGIWNKKKNDRYQALDCDNLRFGYIDKNGKFVIPPVFMHAYSFSEGLAAVRIDTNNPLDLEIEQQIYNEQKNDALELDNRMDNIEKRLQRFN